MKKLLLFFWVSISLTELSGQVTLTFPNNNLLPGDSSTFREVSWVDPGDPGENQVWDFSGVQFTGKILLYQVVTDPSQNRSAMNPDELISREDGYDYTYITGENGFEESGCVNQGKRMTVSFSDHMTRMKFPFSFGQQFTDPFAGVVWYCEKSRYDLAGEYTVTADAFGTLILPDRILKNTLRLKTVRKSLQTGTCGSTQSTAVKYFWYAPGYRYPVLMIGNTESIYGSKDPVEVKNGWVNMNQSSSGSLAAITDPSGQTETAENFAVVYPNPFRDQFTYSYFIRQQVPVKVELYDMSGQVNIVVEKRQLQTSGMHTGMLDASVSFLPPGVYYLRFTLDKQAVVSKIVKI